MTSIPINKLTPLEALEQAIKASELLISELGSFNNIESGSEPEKTNKLTQVREKLVQQVFAHHWLETDVATHRADFEKLEQLSSQLINQATLVRHDLHQQRVDNQQGRKAVNAYDKAKGQFHR